MNRTIWRCLAAGGLALVLGTIGGFAGAAWYGLFGPPWGSLGSEFNGWAEIFRGASVGTLAGLFAGWFLAAGGLDRRRRLVVGAGAVAAAVLIVVAVSQIGDLTNTDGPKALAATIILVAALGAAAIVVGIAQITRRRNLAATGPAENL